MQIPQRYLPVSELTKWQEIYGEDAIAFPGGNFFRRGEGYLTQHIPQVLRQDLPSHWDALFSDSKAFETTWQPRPGFLELIRTLAEQSETKPFTILNMGGGLGDLTVELAKIPHTYVKQVDFSTAANQVAQKKIAAHKVAHKAAVVTADNKQFLQGLKDEEKVDLVIFYGSIGEIEPSEQAFEQTLLVGANALKDGGYVYYVSLVQPLITDPTDDQATDILGEYPIRRTLITDILAKNRELQLVKEEVAPRPDKHPLQYSGESIEHMHVIQRALLVKNGDPGKVPRFSFRAALDSN